MTENMKIKKNPFGFFLIFNAKFKMQNAELKWATLSPAKFSPYSLLPITLKKELLKKEVPVRTLL